MLDSDGEIGYLNDVIVIDNGNDNSYWMQSE
jgi:hypothetical protein